MLTRAELQSYPGATFTDKLLSHEREGSERQRAVPAAVRCEPIRREPARPAALRSVIVRRVDIRCFPGRDRTERVMQYVRAHFPRADNWSEEAVRQIADDLLRTAQVVE
jgi:hypothetical protein